MTFATYLTELFWPCTDGISNQAMSRFLNGVILRFVLPSLFKGTFKSSLCKLTSIGFGVGIQSSKLLRNTFLLFSSCNEFETILNFVTLTLKDKIL